MSSGPSPKKLEELLLSAEALAEADPVAKVTWVEAVADAVGSSGLGKAGERAATDLRASLGAIVAYSRAERNPRERVAMEATVRMFATRGLLGLYSALEDAYRELGLSGPNAKRCKELAAIFGELKKSLAQAKPPSDELLQRMRSLAAEVGSEESSS
ncbi:MAG: hypothetical protein HY791_39720 [Deltaproteobacteria bacterium]|nr:hypothetical protein [Deltaproteobacteria bacterium]